MKEHTKQHRLWLLAAVCAPAAHYAGCGWVTALLTAAVALPFSLIPKNWSDLPKPVAVIEILGFGAASGMLLGSGAAYWPSDNDLVVPLTLLSLAACVGGAAAPRIGAVLAFCVALTAVPLAVAAAVVLKPEWLKPAAVRWSPGLALAMLIPNLPAAGKTGKRSGIALVGAMAVILGAAVQGVLSPGVAAHLQDPFHQAARTMGYLEPVAAVGMTLGWFAVGTMLLYSASEVAEESGIRPELGGILAAVAGACIILFGKGMDTQNGSVVWAVLWVVLPFWNRVKKSAKSEK